jgi:beta-galactosidase
MRNKQISYPEFLYGVVYYPEQWPESVWQEDFHKISTMGMNVVRMGEGAWSFWEPEEGRFDFSLFDRALGLCEKFNLKAILGTPTYAPPAWLTERYPEVVRTDFRGQPMRHGSRRHYNYTSPVYIEKCRQIVAQLAEHYKQHQAVIGWQIDNELNCHVNVSFAASDHEAFRLWCRERYKTLDSLNQAWGTVFWSQTYTDWTQIWLPRPTATYQNPSLLLDFFRFTSEMTVQFAVMQSEILRSIAPHQFVTHNTFRGVENLDLAALTNRALNFISYDSYPGFLVEDQRLPPSFRDRSGSETLSRIRGISPKFLILEQQSGPGGQIGGVLTGLKDYLHVTPRPGQMRLWVWQSIAHGADGLLYFRWRSLPYGAESHWNGLIYHDQRNTRRLEEAARIGNEISRISYLLLQSRCAATAAILYNYDNASHTKIEAHTGQHRRASTQAVYRALNQRHVTTDVVCCNGELTSEALSSYKIVFFPHAHILDETELAVLEDYVRAGGTLIFGAWSAYRNKQHWCYWPFGATFYEALVGVRVADFTVVLAHETSSLKFAYETVPAPVFNEILEPTAKDVTVLAEYTSSYYAGRFAVSSRPIGKGRAVHFGAFYTPENATALLDALALDDPLVSWVEVPAEIEAVQRQSAQEGFYVFLNYTGCEQKLHFKETVYDLLESRKLSGEHWIEPYGVRLVRK